MRLRWAAVVLGIGLALVAIRLDDRRVAWAALGVLSVALVLRFLMPRPGATDDSPDEASGTPRRDGPDA